MLGVARSIMGVACSIMGVACDMAGVPFMRGVVVRLGG